jgi:hypothetical protein
MKPKQNLGERVWPFLIDFWIAGVLAVFLILRVVGSATGKHLLKLLGLG